MQSGEKTKLTFPIIRFHIFLLKDLWFSHQLAISIGFNVERSTYASWNGSNFKDCVHSQTYCTHFLFNKLWIPNLDKLHGRGNHTADSLSLMEESDFERYHLFGHLYFHFEFRSGGKSKQLLIWRVCIAPFIELP